jgi:flagellar biosynthesis GTPase FlhF
MPNYAKTVIYKIVCKDVNIKQSYGGHTTNIIKRRQAHKTVCNNINTKNYNFYLYKFIRENGGWDNWEMLWCYDFPCNLKREAELEERNFIEKEKCELNCIKRPHTTEEEKIKEKKEYQKKYQEQNKDKIKEQNKKYNEEHKEQKKEYNKKYSKNHYQNNKEAKKKYQEEHKEQKKEYNKKYRQQNKKKIAERDKKYKEENKDKIKEHTKQKFTCICNSTITIGSKARHEKSKKHIEFCHAI